MLGACPLGSQKRKQEMITLQKRQGQNITGLPLAFPVVRVLLVRGERLLVQENKLQGCKDPSTRIGNIQVITEVIDVATT